MNQEIGKQYNRDKITDTTGFLEKARLHQSKYRTFNLGVPFDKYGNYLRTDDAMNGMNFYDDFNIFQEVKKRYPKYSKPLYANMLRSEHIGFNLFIPLKANLGYAKKIFNELLNDKIQSIDKIEIEYAPAPTDKYLNDKTSFDTYIEYTHIDNQKGIIGIEVKYTEHEYQLKPGSKQEQDIIDKNSKYYLITEKCGLYKPDTIDKLITDNFRQIWRNQLLGESILIEDSDKYSHFTSLMIFPKGNLHFIETSKEYMDMLIKNTDHFLPVTYENFLSICNKYRPNSRFEKWLDYLLERYIVEN
ncbi:hypothetical protein [Marinilabilia sp.]|uniref:PGN_0703 family putative restriction endonuclease n=1 Tax=Marinilabilia sp. TaxID=2021252 RepID=UPI0025C39CDC|nr:hypothetical protein [Marinilabilia sp.]